MALRGTRRARSANRVSDWFREAGVIGFKLRLLTIIPPLSELKRLSSNRTFRGNEVLEPFPQDL